MTPPPSAIYAPGFVRLRYSGVNRPHAQKFGIKFNGTPIPGTEPSFETSDGGTISMSTGVNAWITAQQDCFSTVTNFGFADCYAVDATTGIQTFIFTMNIGLLGTSASPQIAKSEGVYVFKTNNGKPLKIYQMEATWTTDIRNLGVVPADGRQDVIDYILSTSNILYGLKNAFPLAFISFTSKENDVLRRAQLPTV